jgi:endonuclease G
MSLKYKVRWFKLSSVLAVLLSFGGLSVLSAPETWLKEFVYAGLPRKADYPNDIQVLENDFYIVGYDNAYMNPAWVACRFKKSFGDRFTNFPRPEQTLWTVDRRTSARVCDGDFDGAGYDRGHMAPNFGMMKSNGPGAQLDTFRMSNIIPQKADLNRYAWKDLEHQICSTWLKKYGDLWVITGPIYGSHPTSLHSGIRIPKAFYKIVLDETSAGNPRVLSFIFPQDAQKSAKPADYLTSVDEVEKQTGFDFLSDLDDSLEQQIESVVSSTVW